MYQPDVVYGLVRADEELDRTLRDLRDHGVHATEIEVVEPTPGRYELADEYLHEEAVAARDGAALGAPIGLGLAGVVALILATATDAGAVELAVLGLAGLGFGGMVGAMYGMQRRPHLDDDPIRYAELDDPTSWRLVGVHCLHWRNRAHRILLAHGAMILDSGRPASRA